MSRIRFALPLAALALGLPAAQAQDGMIALTPEQVGQVFCISRIAGDTGPIEGLLTEGLAAAIADAEAKDAAWAAANPGDKPPLGDGVPWQSYQDYASQCSPAGAELMMDEARVPIEYGFPEYPDAGFTDYLLLRLVDGPYGARVWRIDDIAYAIDGRLRETLVSVFVGN